MRIKAIKVQDGEAGRGYSGDILFLLDPDPCFGYVADLARAVEVEHPCEESQCDIHAALCADCPCSAAWLLSSATECPVMERVVWAHLLNGNGTYNPFSGETPPDFQEWAEYHSANGRQCEKCGAFTFVDPEDGWEPDECGNCLAPLPEVDPCE